jgi:transposase, IS5 family
MRPKRLETTRSDDLFRARLEQIINLKHELAQLAGHVDRDSPYEFGVKSRSSPPITRAPGGQFVLHAKALPGNPYDWHLA